MVAVSGDPGELEGGTLVAGELREGVRDVQVRVASLVVVVAGRRDDGDGG